MARIRTASGEEERRILTAMIVNRTVLARIASRWAADARPLFASEYANLICEWCVKYFRQYDAPPGADIEGLFEAWANERNRDKDLVASMERLLGALSGEYERQAEEINPDYVIDQAGRHFTRVRVRRDAEAALADLDMGDLEKAESRFLRYGRVDLGAGTGLDVLHDVEASRAAYEGKKECLIEYGGALGEFFAGQLVRDSLIGVMAPDKSGKSYWLQDMAWRAACQRRKTLYVVVGDLSQDQAMRRLHSRAAGWPEDPGVVKRPVKWFLDGETHLWLAEHEEREYEEGMTWQRGVRAFNRAVRNRIKSNEMYLQLLVYPSMAIDMPGLRSEIHMQEQRGWVPDVVVIDYADNILGPREMDPRDQSNFIWASMRQMAQQLHCLTISATQTDAKAYDAHVITRKNFSNDKRKLAHVSAMMAVNIRDAERQTGVCRLNWTVKRVGAYSENRCVSVAGCLAVGNPAIMSRW